MKAKHDQAGRSKGAKPRPSRKAEPEADLIPGLEVATVAEPKVRYSAFNELGFKQTLEVLGEEIRELYLEDQVPWILGYSGGKDSTATLQLIWQALQGLNPEQRTKTVHVISTDTLVENPVVASWVQKSLEVMEKSAQEQGMPIVPRLLRPQTEESFWVNLIGRGYPAPRHKFRWCTERLKIRPSNRFISQIVSKNGEAILALGARREESQARAKVLKKNEKYRIRNRLSPSATLAGCLIYTPIEDWTSDDVWMFLTQVKNPWGHSNRDLMGMYAGASADGECPLVVDTSTPSCGDSRFGCWVCTLVEKDKSMTAMIQNDAEKEWMMPLLDLRNALDFRSNATVDDPMNSDHHLRDFRRMSGVTQLMTSESSFVPGPYHQEARENWLRKLLEAQTWIRKQGPADVRDIELITLDELQEIRRLWVVDKHELEDRLPRVYREATGEDYPCKPLDDQSLLGPEQMEVLASICGDDRLHYEMARELLSVTMQQQASARRAGLYDKLEKSIKRHFFDDRDDALSRAKRRAELLRSSSNTEGGDA
jgi:DNA sulfur modification protein DndC